MLKIIFACLHNARCSQMAAAYFYTLVNDQKATAVSAGTQAAEHVHHEVVTVMKEVGMDLITTAEIDSRTFTRCSSARDYRM